MAKKNGNGEGSIYEHKRNGKRVGYRGAYTVYTAEGPKRRYVSGKTREEVRHKLTKAMADRDGGLIFDAGHLRVRRVPGAVAERLGKGYCAPEHLRGTPAHGRAAHSP